MLYDAKEIAKRLNISTVTAYAKLKLDEIKPLIISQNGKSFVDDKGLEAIKQSLKYNQSITEDEVSATEVEVLKDDMIESLKANIDFLKEQLSIKDQQLLSKDDQIKEINQLFTNTQVLFKQAQVQNQTILALPETIKEHDIELVNTLTSAMERQKEAFLAEKQNQKQKGFFSVLFGTKE